MRDRFGTEVKVGDKVIFSFLRINGTAYETDLDVGYIQSGHPYERSGREVFYYILRILGRDMTMGAWDNSVALMEACNER